MDVCGRSHGNEAGFSAVPPAWGMKGGFLLLGEEQTGRAERAAASHRGCGKVVASEERGEALCHRVTGCWKIPLRSNSPLPKIPA